MCSALPAQLHARLTALGQKYHDRGIDLFVFRSFAREDNRPNSDLDLGIEWRGPHSRALIGELQQEVDKLPTIRPIDLVDFSRASPQWKSIAGRESPVSFRRMTAANVRTGALRSDFPAIVVSWGGALREPETEFTQVWDDIIRARNTAVQVYREADAERRFGELQRFQRTFDQLAKSLPAA